MAEERKNRDGLLFAGLVLIAISIVGSSLLIHRDLKSLIKGGGTVSPPSPSPTQEGGAEEAPGAQEYTQWRSLIRPFNPTYGPEDAPVTIIEFSDFQCPFCKRFHDTTRGEILRKYQGKVRFVYKHFPLEQIHPSARDAAIASQCAFREGKFWELHDRIFEKQRDLSKEALLQWGKELALPANYTVCLTKQETSAEVDQDFKDGLEVGVRGTPTFLINGRILSGALPFPFFQKEIERYL